jgi:predicted deacetylase
MDVCLLVSLSGVAARTLDACADLAAELDSRRVPLSMLFTPGRDTDTRTDRDTDTRTEWMRSRVQAGDEVLLHGYDHSIPPTHRAVQLGRKAEFAALPVHEARLRLVAASAALERAGLRAAGFAPPRWLISRGTLRALREQGFPLCADLSAVHDLRTGQVRRARVQGFGLQRQPTETLRCFALVLSATRATRAARRHGLVRLGVDAADLTRAGRRQAFLDAVDIALESGAHGSTYSAALTGRVPA